MSDVQFLTRYKAWGDDLFLSAAASIPPVELTAPRPIVFGSLLRTLHHAYAMDCVWQCHLVGKPHGFATRNPEQCPGIDELSRSQRRIDEWYVSYAASIGTRALDEVIDFEFIGGGAGSMTRREILLHVVNHASYHRGHAAYILYAIGIAPPVTDLPVFVRSLARAP